jgi:hypothetical protein
LVGGLVACLVGGGDWPGVEPGLFALAFHYGHFQFAVSSEGLLEVFIVFVAVGDFLPSGVVALADLDDVVDFRVIWKLDALAFFRVLELDRFHCLGWWFVSLTGSMWNNSASMPREMLQNSALFLKSLIL